MMGGWAPTPDESPRTESCLVAEESAPRLAARVTAPSYASAMLMWLRQLGSCLLTVCELVSVYKIKHICGSS